MGGTRVTEDTRRRVVSNRVRWRWANEFYARTHRSLHRLQGKSGGRSRTAAMKLSNPARAGIL
jgi:hypothetical protein